jgi:L-lactate dehydrogenase (cytochrome)
VGAAASIGDYRELARRRLPHFLFEYIDGGSYDEVTLRRNIIDMAEVALRQRVLRDVSQIDTSIMLFGQRLSVPVVLAPIGLAGMNARRGECQAARAAARAIVPFCLSTVSLCSLEEVVHASQNSCWFQLYMIRDRSVMTALLAEAERLDCPALIFTVDMPVPGSRYRDYRSGLAGAPGWMGDLRRLRQALARPRWALDVGLLGRPHRLGNVAAALEGKSGLEDFFAWMGQNFDARVTWDDIAWVRAHWRRPLILKGILDPSDAREAARLGVDGIVVSNHGGRQLDGVLSSTRALPAVVDAVGDQLTVLVDGGIRSGLDVIRMLALGAKGVLIGRAWAYALAAQGEPGVARVLELLAAEMKVAMALTGRTRIRDVNRAALAMPDVSEPVAVT